MAGDTSGFEQGHQSPISSIEPVVAGEDADTEETSPDAEPAEEGEVTETQDETTHSAANVNLRNAESEEKDRIVNENGSSDSTDTKSKSGLLGQITDEFSDL